VSVDECRAHTVRPTWAPNGQFQRDNGPAFSDTFTHCERKDDEMLALSYADDFLADAPTLLTAARIHWPLNLSHVELLVPLQKNVETDFASPTGGTWWHLIQ